MQAVQRLLLTGDQSSSLLKMDQDWSKSGQLISYLLINHFLFLILYIHANGRRVWSPGWEIKLYIWSGELTSWASHVSTPPASRFILPRLALLWLIGWNCCHSPPPSSQVPRSAMADISPRATLTRFPEFPLMTPPLFSHLHYSIIMMFNLCVCADL